MRNSSHRQLGDPRAFEHSWTDARPESRAPLDLNRIPAYRRVLLLQGPVGPFFRRVGDILTARGSQVTKVNFNSGDDWFYSDGDIVRFSATLEEWPEFLEQLLVRGGYEAVILFGDCRPVHKAARAVVGALRRAVWVFEEGYFRPNYITLEQDGVNAFSGLMALSVEELRKAPGEAIAGDIHFANLYSRMGWKAFTYFAVMYFGARRYPHYVHHKPSGWVEGLRWVRAGMRKSFYRALEGSTVSHLLSAERRKRFFVFPLQVRGDSQLHTHSDWRTPPLFLRHVAESFARHGSKEDWLVIKHHPMERGHTNYGRIIAKLSKELGLAGRLHYVHDMHLPTLLDNCKGLVTVNSTTGLQGLDHGLPVITLGRAFYNKQGITFQGCLDLFWTTDWNRTRISMFGFAHGLSIRRRSTPPFMPMRDEPRA